MRVFVFSNHEDNFLVPRQRSKCFRINEGVSYPSVIKHMGLPEITVQISLNVQAHPLFVFSSSYLVHQTPKSKATRHKHDGTP